MLETYQLPKDSEAKILEKNPQLLIYKARIIPNYILNICPNTHRKFSPHISHHANFSLQ